MEKDLGRFDEIPPCPPFFKVGNVCREAFLLIAGPLLSERLSPIKPGRFQTASPLTKGVGGIWFYRFGYL